MIKVEVSCDGLSYRVVGHSDNYRICGAISSLLVAYAPIAKAYAWRDGEGLCQFKVEDRWDSDALYCGLDAMASKYPDEVVIESKS